MHIAPMQPPSQLDVDVFRRGATKASGHQHCRKEWMDTRLLAQGLDSPKQECIEPTSLCRELHRLSSLESLNWSNLQEVLRHQADFCRQYPYLDHTCRP